jgi:phosphatidylethanolamine/phosphatidyl-N-methylethanolamine N-methyltransferase
VKLVAKSVAEVAVDREAQKKIYERWAPIYDQIYAKLLSDAHKRTVKAVSQSAKCILEVGVGTGLMLPYYPDFCEIYGVDLSSAMLKRAKSRVKRLGLNNVKMLAAMDACQLGFVDECFDAVAIPFMITLVPEPERALDEAVRVLKSGGQLVITTRFGADEGPQAKVEEFIAPLVKKIGWSSSFKLARVRRWATAHGGLVVHAPERTSPAGYFKMIRVQKS